MSNLHWTRGLGRVILPAMSRKLHPNQHILLLAIALVVVTTGCAFWPLSDDLLRVQTAEPQVDEKKSPSHSDTDTAGSPTRFRMRPKTDSDRPWWDRAINPQAREIEEHLGL